MPDPSEPRPSRRAAGEDGDVKNALRREARNARRQVPQSTAGALSREACERVQALPEFANASRVVLYRATDGEVATEPLADAARTVGKRIFYPSVVDSGLQFLEDQGHGWRPGEWGIPEPISDQNLGAIQRDTLVVVPGVAFDLNGHRLGRGRGAYDRTLGRDAAAVRIGLAYEFQIVPLLPCAPWDVPMDAVVTNARVIDARHTRDGMEGRMQ